MAAECPATAHEFRRWRLDIGLALRSRPWLCSLIILACLAGIVLVLPSSFTASVVDRDGADADNSEEGTASAAAAAWTQPMERRPWPAGDFETRDLLENVYKDLDGFQLRKDDAERSSAKGTFHATYGEFTTGGVNTLMEVLNITHDDVFCDLGSGTGKVVMQVYLARRPLEAVGVELSETRHEKAVEAQGRLWKSTLLPAGAPDSWRGALRYVHGDIMDVDAEIAKCSKIFFCSTVWPKPMLDKMQQKFLNFQFTRSQVLLVSSRELKEFGELLEPRRVAGARFVRHAKVDTSWGASFITLYALKDFENASDSKKGRR